MSYSPAISVNFIVGHRVLISHFPFLIPTLMPGLFCSAAVLTELSKVFLVKNAMLYSDVHQKCSTGSIFLFTKKSSSIAWCRLMPASQILVSVIPAEIYNNAVKLSFIFSCTADIWVLLI